MPILTPQERIGTCIGGGRYRIERLLARGGMSVVFEAHDLRTRRPVAVKFLKADDCVDERRIARFLQEMRLTAELRDPHVVDVLDLGQEDAGAPYLVMELLRGRSLQAELDARGKLEVEEALALVLPVMSALTGVHSAGVIHRDVKPDNIFLHVDGTGRVVPKLLDFGIAKHAFATFGTRTGAMLGTPDYMAPEQVLGEEISPATDVWAMGAVLYRTLCGETPFHASTTAQTLAKLAREPAPLLRVPGVPAALSAAVDRALAREVSGRYTSMGEFADAIVTCAREAGFAVPVRDAAPAAAHDAPTGAPGERTRGASLGSMNAQSKRALRPGLRNAVLVLALIALGAIGMTGARGSTANAPVERTRPQKPGADSASFSAVRPSEPTSSVQAEIAVESGDEHAAATGDGIAQDASERGSPVAVSGAPLRRAATKRALVRRPAAQTKKPLQVGDLPVALEW